MELQYVQKIVEATKGEEIPEEGENLYFAVEPKNGYEIIEVLVNGEWLEAVEDLDSLVRETAPEWR